MKTRILTAAAVTAAMAGATLVATTATATAATVTLDGTLTGPQLSGWTYYAAYSTDDDYRTHTVSVGANGSYAIDIDDLSDGASVYIQYFAKSPAGKRIDGFYYNDAWDGITVPSQASTYTLDAQQFSAIQGEVYDRAKGAAAGGLKGRNVAVLGANASREERMDGGREWTRSGADGSFTLPLIYANDTRSFKVSAGDYDTTYLPAVYQGSTGTYFETTAAHAKTGVNIGLKKGGVVKGTIKLPKGATDIDRIVSLWTAKGKWLDNLTATKSGHYSFNRLETGTYRVSFGRASKLIGNGNYADTTVSKLPPTFYRDILENKGMKHGAKIKVTVSKTTKLKKVAPKASWGGSVSGKLLFKYAGKWRGPNPKHDDFAAVYIVDPKNNLSSRADQLNTNGEWKVTGLAPGRYTVYAVGFFNKTRDGDQTAFRKKKLGRITIRSGTNATFKHLHY